MLYGLPSLGKTPVAWQMAQAIQTGQPIWGFPTQQANVLFIEIDLSLHLAYSRWKTAEPEFIPSFTMAFPEASINYKMLLNEIYPDDWHREIIQQFKDLHRRKQFGVVFIDALRQVVVGDLSNSGIAHRVYDAFRNSLFPGASVVFIHHERKPQAERYGGSSDPMFTASGSMEWQNTAQVTLNVRRARGARPGERFMDVLHVKSQASEMLPPIPLGLGDDGVNIFRRDHKLAETVSKIIVDNPNATMRELDELIANELGISDRTARKYRLAAQQKQSKEETSATDSGG